MLCQVIFQISSLLFEVLLLSSIYKWGRTSPMVQWLRLHAPNARGLGSIPGQGTRSHMPQLRPGTAKWIHFFFKIDRWKDWHKGLSSLLEPTQSEVELVLRPGLSVPYPPSARLSACTNPVLCVTTANCSWDDGNTKEKRKIRLWLCMLAGWLVWVIYLFGHTLQFAGSKFHNQGWNPCPLQRKRRDLTLGLQGSPRVCCLLGSFQGSLHGQGYSSEVRMPRLEAERVTLTKVPTLTSLSFPWVKWE